MADAEPSPRDRIRTEVGRRGLAAFVAGCGDLLAGEYGDTELIGCLGGANATYVLAGHEGPYWFRVWAARGLLWAWDGSALPAITGACTDEAWRVREMAAKVIARHLVGDALPAVAELAADPVPRVRRAAERAVAALTEAKA